MKLWTKPEIQIKNQQKCLDAFLSSKNSELKLYLTKSVNDNIPKAEDVFHERLPIFQNLKIILKIVKI